jgi:hypothetical protein
MLSIDHMLLDGAAEADPVLDALLDPCQLDMREFAHATFHSAAVPPIGRCRGARMSAVGSLGDAAEVHLGPLSPRGALFTLTATTR